MFIQYIKQNMGKFMDDIRTNLLTINSGTTGYSFPQTVGTENEMLILEGGNLVFKASPFAGGGTVGTVVTEETYFVNTTSSTDSGTGALVVSGGVGISENLNVAGDTNFGGDLIVENTFTIGAGTTGYSFPVAEGDEGDILVMSGGELVFQPNTLESGTSGTVINNNTTISSTSVSTSITSGALVVSGGAGISGDLNLGGSLATNGSVSVKVRTFTTTTGLTNLADDYVLNVDNSGTATVVLPDLTDPTYVGTVYVVIKLTANTVNLTTQPADKIFNGSDVDTIPMTSSEGERIQVMNNGLKWFIM
jgi:hypothetical protein